MKRQFSFPYNGEEVGKYLDKLNEYKEYIHDVYLGTPVVKDFFSKAILLRNPDYYTKCHEFFEKVKDTDLKTVIVVNGEYDDIPQAKQQDFLQKLFNYIRDYNIYGAVCSDFIIAEELRTEFPELEINTSCNCPHYELHHLNVWKERVGIKTVNPPRDASRNFSYLKKLKEAGYKIKLLINETCYVNCPFISSFCKVSQEKRQCIRTHLKIAEEALNPFKTCIIFPNWLEKFDEVVDIYKISGRLDSTKYIFNVLDAFVKYPERECYISDIVGEFPKGIKIKADNVPLYLSDCNKQCKSCGKCDELLGFKLTR